MKNKKLTIGKQNSKNKSLKTKSGITLIALIITIIVMLILVGVTLSVALNGGLISRAQEAKTGTQYEKDKEMLYSSVVGAVNDKTEVDFNKLNENLPNGFTKADDGGYTSKSGNTFYVSKNGNITDEPKLDPIPITENCEGYYANLDGDSEPDGIIYADLAIGSEGPRQWGDDWGIYEYNAETEDLKTYIKEAEEVASAKFGNYKAPMVKLSEESTGTNNRFYVMALDDVDNTTHTWYASARGNLDKKVGSYDNDFGQGEVNTEYVYKPEVAAVYRNFRSK